MNNREIDHDDDTLPDGQLIGQLVDDRFLIQKAIGKGGAGEVFLACDTKMLDRRVVVKVLLADWIGHDDVRRKFEHEKEALLRLDHPGIVSILDAGTLEQGQPYIVMPFVEGQTLQRYLKENSLPPLEICAGIIEATADALSAAHSVGILHRDIKPANIMISFLPSKKLRVKIIDFGIARVFESKVSPITHIGRPLGTVLYVAPEQLLGHHEQTPAADVYSCGIMAFKMLTGVRPFEPQSMFEMAELHREGLKKLPSSIRPELGPVIDEILLKALAYSPDERYQEISEFG
ncbi:MAG: serine/threonine-protein kinase, partial [Acidobacteriota bacterium]